jgi:predicted MFS family arabinose efflux permease
LRRLAGQEPEKKTFGNTVAVLMVVVAGLGPLTFGYTLGFTSPSTLPMEVGRGPWLYEAVFDKSSLSWKAGSSEIDSSESSLFGSLVNVGCMIGAMIAGPLADFAGRKLAIASAAVPWLGAWLLVGFGSSFGPILAGRVLSGIATGVASMTVPLYIAETAPASLRGALGAVNQHVCPDSNPRARKTCLCMRARLACVAVGVEMHACACLCGPLTMCRLRYASSLSQAGGDAGHLHCVLARRRPPIQAADRLRLRTAHQLVVP